MGGAVSTNTHGSSIKHASLSNQAGSRAVVARMWPHASTLSVALCDGYNAPGSVGVLEKSLEACLQIMPVVEGGLVNSSDMHE